MPSLQLFGLAPRAVQNDQEGVAVVSRAPAPTTPILPGLILLKVGFRGWIWGTVLTESLGRKISGCHGVTARIQQHRRPSRCYMLLDRAPRLLDVRCDQHGAVCNPKNEKADRAD